MTLEEYINNTNKPRKKRSYFKKIIITIIITLITLIVCKTNNKAKEYIDEYLFNTNFHFSKVNKLYNKYVLNIKENATKLVANTSNSKWIEYKDGVSKYATNGYDKINSVKNGIVVFIGEKEGIGKTLIIEQTDGVDAWYSNIDEVNVNMYSYVENNKELGTFKDKLYLSFWKNGEKVDYKKYIK